MTRLARELRTDSTGDVAILVFSRLPPLSFYFLSVIISRSTPLVQPLSSVITKQGRCLAFPNVYQRQVSPFELVDKTKPGHRKILVFFLVNPQVVDSVPSTLNVPPQQKAGVCTRCILATQ